MEFNKTKNNADPLILAGIINPSKTIQRKSYIMYPNDRFIIFWDLVITIILLISCIMTPINLAFSHLEDDAGWTAATLIIDSLFLIDIFINFFSAYEDQDLRIQDDRKLIV